MARPKKTELLTPRFVVWCSIQLSYGRVAGRGREGDPAGGPHPYRLAGGLASAATPEAAPGRRPRPVTSKSRQRYDANAVSLALPLSWAPTVRSAGNRRRIGSSTVVAPGRIARWAKTAAARIRVANAAVQSAA